MYQSGGRNLWDQSDSELAFAYLALPLRCDQAHILYGTQLHSIECSLFFGFGLNWSNWPKWPSPQAPPAPSAGLTLAEVHFLYWNKGVNRSKMNKVFKHISRFLYIFSCVIIYYDIWNQFIVKIVSNPTTCPPYPTPQPTQPIPPLPHSN